MKKLLLFILAAATTCLAQTTPPPRAATQAEADNGTSRTVFISPFTLSGWSGARAWGTLVGTLSNQADLQAALNLKLSTIGGTATNPTLVGFTLTGATVISYTTMPGTAINVAKPGNAYSVADDVTTLTFSNATPTDGTETLLIVTADVHSGGRTISIPQVWSINRSGNINNFTVPSGGSVLVKFRYTGARWEIVGDPVSTSGTGSYVLVTNATLVTPTILAILSGGFTNTLPQATGTLLSTAATITVAQGGSGLATTTAYGPIFTGTTATGAWKADTGPGTINYVMTSNGAGQYPTWQATQAAGAGLPVPTATPGKFVTWRSNGNTLSVVNDTSANGPNGTFLSVVPSATEGMVAQYTCAATTATQVGVVGYGHWRVGRSLYYATNFKLSQTTNERLWLGFTDVSAFNQAGSANPSGNFAMFRYDSAVGVNWYACTKDGTTITATDTGVAADTSFHLFEIVSNDGVPNIIFKIGGSTVATATSSEHLPTSGTNLSMQTNGQTLANEAKAVQFEFIYATATK